jgi:Family of unknown function (DUF6000)
MIFFRKKKQLSNSEIIAEAEKHSAGQTIKHKSPFTELKEPFIVEEVSEEFMKNWMIGFYMDTFFLSNENDQKFIEILKKVDEELIKKQLGFFNWRCRLIGSYFSAILDLKQYEEIIGIHLLKSELSFAGEGYIIALASFNSEKAIETLINYSNYYLIKRNMIFQQTEALAALILLDKKNGTNKVQELKLMELWKKFNQKNPALNLDDTVSLINSKLEKVEKYKSQLKNGI